MIRTSYNIFHLSSSAIVESYLHVMHTHTQPSHTRLCNDFPMASHQRLRPQNISAHDCLKRNDVLPHTQPSTRTHKVRWRKPKKSWSTGDGKIRTAPFGTSDDDSRADMHRYNYRIIQVINLRRRHYSTHRHNKQEIRRRTRYSLPIKPWIKHCRKNGLDG